MGWEPPRLPRFPEALSACGAVGTGGGLACPVPAASVGDFVSFEYPKFPFFMGFLALSEINALVIELVEFKNINLIKARLRKERSEQAL